MVIRTNVIYIDTCNCVLEFTWDDSVAQNLITKTPTNVFNTCTAHSVLETLTDKFNTTHNEMAMKNFGHQIILDNGPNTLYDLIGISRVLKGNLNIIWSWSGTAPNRILTLTVVGVTLTNAQKNTIQNALNTRFGTGKVLIA